MKKSILFALVAGAVIFIFISASKDKDIKIKAGEKNSSTVDFNPSGCWTRDSGSTKEILTFHFLIDSGPHEHFFYLENYFLTQCPQFYWIMYPGAYGGIGTMDGLKFSYTFFGPQDTSLYTGLITDTITGQRRLELYSKNDTTEFLFNP